MSEERLFRWLSLALVAGVLAALPAGFRDHPTTPEERALNRYGNRVLSWYATLGDDSRAVEIHDTPQPGALFELSAKLAMSCSPLGVYETRHLVSALYAFVGILAAWWIGWQLAGALGGFVSALFLASTPQFFGLRFDSREVPFASLFMLAVATLVWLRLDRLPGPGWRVLTRLALAGLAVGLAAALDVSGLTLLPLAASAWLLALSRTRAHGRWPLRRPLWLDLARTALDIAIVSSTAWLVMVLLWPLAQLDPFRNPFLAGGLALLERPRLDALRLLALRLPEFYAVGLLMGAWRIVAVLRKAPLPEETLSKLRHLCWLAVTTAMPLLFLLLGAARFDDGDGRSIVIVPLLAVIAAVGAAWWLRGPLPAWCRVTGALLLAALVGLTGVEMVAR